MPATLPAGTATADEAQRHYLGSLERALGPEVLAALTDADVTEAYVNPTGRIFLDTRSRGRVDTGTRLPTERVTRFLNLVASRLPAVINAGRPTLQAELPPDPPFRGARLQGFVPPLVAAPAFNLRKPPAVIYTLDEYVATGVLAPDWRQLLGHAVLQHRNVLVAGGTASGKTTLVNALLHEITAASRRERIVILEDTIELQCSAPDCLALRTSDGVRLRDLVKAALRTSPDRIVVGEVRDEAALDLLDAWQTGHPGGVATLHANDPLGALHRLDRLAQRASVPPQPHLVGDAIHLVVMIAGGSAGRRVTEIARVQGYDGWRHKYRLESIPPGAAG
jgi:type IV secretion system protein TrbB